MRAAFAVPGFRRLYAALTASMFGDSAMLIVLSMWVKTLTGSNALAGLTFFFMVVPALAGPLVGTWVDRARRRPVLVWGNLASAVAVLPLLLVRDAGQVWVIWCVAFLYGISFVTLPAALNGLLKETVPDALLVDANASLQTTKEAFRLVGPLVGAGLFAWLGGWAVALLDAATFVVAALVIAGLRVEEARPEPPDRSVLAQTVEGLRFLVTERVLRHVAVGLGLALLVLGFAESSIYALLDAFGHPATWASALLTATGVGAVAGGLSTGAAVRRVGEVAATVAGLALMAVSAAGVAMAPTFPLALVGFAAFGVSLPVALIAVTTLVQRRSPQRLMGRVSAGMDVALSAPQAASLALGSLLVSLVTYRAMFWAMAVVIALGAAWVALALRTQIRADLTGPSSPTPAPPGGPASSRGPRG